MDVVVGPWRHEVTSVVLTAVSGRQCRRTERWPWRSWRRGDCWNWHRPSCVIGALQGSQTDKMDVSHDPESIVNFISLVMLWSMFSDAQPNVWLVWSCIKVLYNAMFTSRGSGNIPIFVESPENGFACCWNDVQSNQDDWFGGFKLNLLLSQKEFYRPYLCRTAQWSYGPHQWGGV